MRGLILFITLIGLNSYGQDTTKELSYLQFIDLVKNNHPIAYQAELQARMGDAKLLKAKGGFDPKLIGEASQKYFEDKQYYSHLHGGVKVPTWFGITAQAGYNNNNGVRLNPELYTPDPGLWYAGLSVNLGNGLFIDARRAELKQARIYQNSSLMEQRLMLNQLVFDASVSYWDWYKSHSKVEVYKEAVENAKIRLNAVRESALLGDKPFVDTLKALLQVQERQLYLEQTLLDLANKKALLEVFLWQGGYVPLELDSTAYPQNYEDEEGTLPSPAAILNMDTLVANHPEITLAENKIAISKIDYRLKKEALKPIAQLKYNALSSPVNDNVFASYTVENYNWGAYVAYPIFTRKERGNLKLAALKVEEQEALLANKNAEVQYKIEATYNTWLSSKKQVDIYRAALGNYILLYLAELTLFNTGESSLFLVNTRDQDMIDAQVKLIDMVYQNHISESLFKYQTVNF